MVWMICFDIDNDRGWNQKKRDGFCDGFTLIKSNINADLFSLSVCLSQEIKLKSMVTVSRQITLLILDMH